MFGTARPVDPGTERTNCSWLCPLFYPGGNRRVSIDPISSLTGITKVHLAIFKVDTRVTKRRAYAFLPSFDLLMGVWVSTEHDVVAARLKCGAHHGLNLILSVHDFPRCGSGCDLPGF